KIYKVTVDGSEKYTKADGTLGEEADKAAITGTSITGLENGKTYKVEEDTSSPISTIGRLIVKFTNLIK
ncbi:hypothetical protein IC216_07530, partial [Clostridioides sp. ES-S-0145-01]|uniref:hypothetical protein n=1 Tax=Clostridioides sp. ES-S-0145-01 TaxID=2770784 RepID=UPI001D0F929C|nr:hypothetical protein [Clostridioides sp. ES-S-0145-01]